MSDPIQTYGMDKIDDLVVSGVVDDRIDIPEEIQTQMADEIEPEVDIERDLDVFGQTVNLASRIAEAPCGWSLCQWVITTALTGLFERARI